MKFTPLPDIITLKELLDYDTDTGLLFWKERSAKWFSDGYMSAQGRANNWNSKNANKEALGHIHSLGYKQGRLANKTVKAHRVAWKLYHGEEPHCEIDHINGIRHDNRMCNLRLAEGFQNRMNICRYKNNSSGVTGVHWLEPNKKWRAVIRANNVIKHIGLFADLEDAIKARKDAEIKLGFHENHGREGIINYP